MKFKYLIFALLPFAAVAKEKGHNHEAHVHGGATLAIAFDSNSGKIEFQGAADGVLGFEHKPKSDKDKKTIDDATAVFESKIAEMIKFDSSLNCTFTKDRLGLFFKEKGKASGDHSDWIATYTVVCAKSPQNTELTVDFTRFEHIDDLDITLLIGNIQKSAEYKKKPLKIDLK